MGIGKVVLYTGVATATVFGITAGTCAVCTTTAVSQMESEKTISKAQYDKVTPGMTYEEVKKIFGKEGEEVVSSSTELPTLSGKSETHTMKSYTWSNGGAVVTVVFENNKVASKSQIGL